MCCVGSWIFLDLLLSMSLAWHEKTCIFSIFAQFSSRVCENKNRGSEFFYLYNASIIKAIRFWDTYSWYRHKNTNTSWNKTSYHHISNQIKNNKHTNQIKKPDIYGTNFEIVSPRHILLKPAEFTTIVTISKNLKTYEFIHTVCPN